MFTILFYICRGFDGNFKDYQCMYLLWTFIAKYRSIQIELIIVGGTPPEPPLINTLKIKSPLYLNWGCLRNLEALFSTLSDRYLPCWMVCRSSTLINLSKQVREQTIYMVTKKMLHNYLKTNKKSKSGCINPFTWTTCPHYAKMLQPGILLYGMVWFLLLWLLVHK